MYIFNPYPNTTDAVHVQEVFPATLEYEIPNHCPIHLVPILDQIKLAFEKSPNRANLLVGARKIKQGARGRRTARFPSRKAGGTIALESRLELAHAIDLERNPYVHDYRAQAICIDLPGNQKAYPDFLVHTISGKYEIHEVKPSIKHLKPALKEKFNLLENILLSLHIKFKIFDATTLLEEAKINQLLQLYQRSHSQPWTSGQLTIAYELLATHKPQSQQESYSLLETHDLPSLLFDYFLFHKKISGSSTSDLLNEMGDII